MTGSEPAPIAPAHITVFGAAGRTGRALMQAAHRAGHRHHGPARNPDRLATTPADRIVAGSVLDPTSVAEALDGADAAILAVRLGPDRRTPLFTTGTRIVIDTMRRQRVPWLIVISEAAYRPHTAGLPHGWRPPPTGSPPPTRSGSAANKTPSYEQAAWPGPRSDPYASSPNPPAAYAPTSDAPRDR